MRRADSTDVRFQTARTAVAILLSVSCIGLLAAITAFGIFTCNREILLGVLRIVAYGIAFSCAWAGGASILRRRGKKSTFSKTFSETGKDGGRDSVSGDVEPYNEG